LETEKGPCNSEVLQQQFQGEVGKLNGSAKGPNISIYFFSPITQWYSISDVLVLFTGGRGVSDYSVLKYH